jgi:hypothetical protein
MPPPSPFSDSPVSRRSDPDLSRLDPVATEMLPEDPTRGEALDWIVMDPLP